VTYPAVCSKRATLLGNAYGLAEAPECTWNRTRRCSVKWPAIRAWGRYHSRVYWIDGRRIRPLGRRHSGRGRAVPVRCPSIVRSSSRGVSVVVPAYAKLDGKSASRSPSHRAMYWSLLGARAGWRCDNSEEAARTERRTTFDYISKPFRDAFWRSFCEIWE
jgi:hypothetical protein